MIDIEEWFYLKTINSNAQKNEERMNKETRTLISCSHSPYSTYVIVPLDTYILA